jgi:hypothetical protein
MHAAVPRRKLSAFFFFWPFLLVMSLPMASLPRCTIEG